MFAHRFLKPFALAALLAVPLAAPVLAADGPDSAGPDSSATDAGEPVGYGPRTALRDIGQYVTSPLRWDLQDWVLFGGSLALVEAAHPFDGRVRRHFTEGRCCTLDGKDKYSSKDAEPALAIVGGTFLYALVIDDPGGYTETWAMLEAGGLAAGTGFVTKFAAGRERPNQTTNSNAWQKGGASFPSVHASAATAIGTVFAESGNDEYRWIRRIVGYGMAAGTDYLRLRHNAHWLSDVVAGSALGAATGVFVVNRENGVSPSSGLSVEPTAGGGVQVAYTVPLH